MVCLKCSWKSSFSWAINCEFHTHGGLTWRRSKLDISLLQKGQTMSKEIIPDLDLPGGLWLLKNFQLQMVLCYPVMIRWCLLFFFSSEALVWRCSVKKVFLTISQNSQENTYAGVTFLLKLQVRLQLS